MCRRHDYTYYSTGPLFYEYLYNNSKISSKVFAFYLSTVVDTSTLEIGGYTSSKMKSSSDLTYLPLTNNTLYWWVNVSAFRIGSSNTFSDGTVSAYDLGSLNSIVDTGTSYLYLPSCNIDSFNINSYLL